MATKTKTMKIKTAGNAKDALLRYEQLKADAEALMEEHGINSMLEEADTIKAQVTEWAVKNDVEAIALTKTRYYGLRRDSYNKRVVGDDEELANVKNPTAVIPLKTIIKKKFGKKWMEVWKAVTTRRVDPAKLEEAVKDGTLTIDEISPAYYEDHKSPYIRAYGK